MRIRYKLLAMLMLVAIPAVLLVGLLGYYSGQRGLRRAAFDRLTSIRESRAFEIHEYFRDARNEIWALSQGPAIIGMAREFREAARALEAQPLAPDEARRLAADLEAHYREESLPRLGGSGFGRDLLDDMLPDDATARRLQYHYLVANPHPVGRKDEKVASDDASAYADAHARHHLYIRGLARQLGYYDIFMIDPETGRIVYSVFKEIDFGTSLTTGPHRESELARVFRAAREATDPRFVKLVDFAPYAPSYGAPASFIASPMFDGDELVAVLAAQMSIDEIDAVMTGRRRWLEDGFGSSGEAYLVGPDFRMRSNSRFLLEDAEGFLLGRAEAGASEEEVARMRRYGTTILQQEVRSAAAVAALGGSSATAIVDDYRGVPVLSSYMPLNISELGWVLLAEIDAAEAFAPVDQFARARVLGARRRARRRSRRAGRHAPFRAAP